MVACRRLQQAGHLQWVVEAPSTGPEIDAAHPIAAVDDWLSLRVTNSDAGAPGAPRQTAVQCAGGA